MLNRELLQELNYRFSTYSSNVLVDAHVLTQKEWDEVKKLFENVDKAYAEIVVCDTVSKPTDDQLKTAYYALTDYVRDDEFIELFEDDNGLPKEVEIPVSSIDDSLDVDEGISNWLSNMYGYCVNNFRYDYMNGDCEDYHVYDIDWDV